MLTFVSISLVFPFWLITNLIYGVDRNECLWINFLDIVHQAAIFIFIHNGNDLAASGIVISADNLADRSTTMKIIKNEVDNFVQVLRDDTNAPFDVQTEDKLVDNNSTEVCGFISDENTGFLFDKTAKENIELFGPLYDDWDDTRFYKAMQKMNLSPGKTVGKMSRGELFKFQTAFANRKLGSDMADSVTGGGLHGKDLSKADVSVNIHAFLKAQRTGEPVELSCAIGDDTVDGLPYSEIVEEAREYIRSVGGFEAFAEWGLY